MPNYVPSRPDDEALGVPDYEEVEEARTTERNRVFEKGVCGDLSSADPVDES